MKPMHAWAKTKGANWFGMISKAYTYLQVALDSNDTSKENLCRNELFKFLEQQERYWLQ